jgi:hypothetical protein
MQRRITLGRSLLSVIAVLAVTAVPAAARAPGGKGLVDFGTVTCDGIGEASLLGPRGLSANSGYLVVGGDAKHVMLTQLEGTITDLEGNVIDSFSKSFGAKVPYRTFTCTQEFEEPGANGELTVTLAFVPPR